MKAYWLKERQNPQFNKPYYVAEGQLTKAEAKKKENGVYGFNKMIPFETESEYLEVINKLKADGFSVRTL